MNRVGFELVAEALGFAALKHRDQRRKDREASPYINHPIALMRVLSLEAGVMDPLVLAGALLHDTVEDTETTPEELAACFGPEIRALVMEVTDDKSLPKAERKRQQVLRAGGASEGARLVKLADKICNLRDMAESPPYDWDLERRRAYFDWAAEVIDQVRGTHPALEALFDSAYARRP
ncbi:bifunctional (p)ppGpp synthetase/guanosine-3',5'-bis(diphosphate) 3'-pyrophosphohydrolase [Thiorhodococcus mannitoliphagus]|uniref:Bifunctional (P)ppGpp synthetase/guanosine-3',5'-bis(Diphosphate) 3'-pyrophosphohydrolase n=1 Tax=Thiorhodococcus mannitoliphagus TaxID=329406 RepID=A0A6P1DSI8_9GAMM|nr:HD domain-containing protein [Thiorhodococcus mannitoliphagus]NEX21048.1 bifunctional (p)ppGpp synthetase/guanosine-3',5'-bis(diphosphate) 3'-pyrophosphohydrolase [Thiorhodococcus mannitoliphagus]